MDYKDRIAEEAESLFMKYGIRAVTMDRYRSELGMSSEPYMRNSVIRIAC